MTVWVGPGTVCVTVDVLFTVCVAVDVLFTVWVTVAVACSVTVFVTVTVGHGVCVLAERAADEPVADPPGPCQYL